MEIIKEYCQEATKYVIRTNTYGHTWEHFNTLVNEAKKDFPNLNVDGIEIVRYSGIRYARTFGIEFRVEGEQHPEYSEILHLENT